MCVCDYQKRMRSAWSSVRCRFFFFFWRLDTIPNSNAATTKKMYKKKIVGIDHVVWPTEKQQKIPDKHTCSPAQHKQKFPDSVNPGVSQSKKGVEKKRNRRSRETRGRGRGRWYENKRKKKVDKDNCTQRRRGAVFYFLKSIQRIVFRAARELRRSFSGDSLEKTFA